MVFVCYAGSGDIQVIDVDACTAYPVRLKVNVSV